VTEQDHPGEVVRALVEAQEWEELEKEGWEAPEQVQAPEENVSALNVGLCFLMRSEFPVLIRPVQNVVQRW
jgi:hypothetical protein